ncbi:unnamed protein product [Orchesella dallaii]|uniref:Zinc finger PHD-type domain-containing protein n=1 Tax=Orchesella dallaii TaxID=48710 RepID=A0ABP1S7Y5_9HEXA
MKSALELLELRGRMSLRFLKPTYSIYCHLSWGLIPAPDRLDTLDRGDCIGDLTGRPGTGHWTTALETGQEGRSTVGGELTGSCGRILIDCQSSMEVQLEASNEEKLLPTSESFGSIISTGEMKATEMSPLDLKEFSVPFTLQQKQPPFFTFPYSQLSPEQSPSMPAVELDIPELQIDSEVQYIDGETEVLQTQDENLPVASAEEENPGGVNKCIPESGPGPDDLSSNDGKQPANFAPEEHLIDPFKCFFDETQDYLQPFIQFKSLKLSSIINELKKRQKKSVISVAKSRNGVLPLRKQYPKVSLLYKRFVPAILQRQLESQRNWNRFARPVQLFKPLKQPKDKETHSKLEEGQQAGLEEVGWLPRKSGLTSSSRCGRSILPPKKYSSGGVVMMQEKAQNEKRKWKKNQFEIGMLPPKYPKRMELSLNRVSDYGYGYGVPHQIENVDETKGTASLMIERIANDSLFQISAIIQSGELHVDSLQRFLEQIKNQTETVNGDNYDDVIDGPNYDFHIPDSSKPAFPSSDQDEIFKVDHNDRKKMVVIGGKKNESKLCSILCQGRGGRIPTLKCIKCLCLVHAECVGVEFSDLLSYSDFICQNCHTLILLRENAKITLNPPTTPPLAAPTSPPVRRPMGYSPVPKSPSINRLNEQSKLIKKPPISKLLPLKVLPLPKPSWTIGSPPMYRFGEGPGFARSKIPVIPIPQLKSFRRPVKIAPRPEEEEFLKYLNSSNGALTISLVNSPPSSSTFKQKQKTSTPPSPSSVLASPFKIPTGRAPQAATAKKSCSFINEALVRNIITITKVPSPPNPRIGAGMNKNLLP